MAFLKQDFGKNTFVFENIPGNYTESFKQIDLGWLN